MGEPIEKPIHRIFDGQLKLCETSNPMLRKVVLMLLNDTVCRNNWLFERIEEHLSDVAEIPILYSVINGKIANGHDFEMVRDAKTGKLYPSFIGSNCEHPAGWIKETEDGKFNPHIENIDGKNWIVAVGTLWVWYNRELIAEIERNGGQMNVSIEADVYKNRIVDGIEYEEDYRIVGVTILGTGVPPAFAGANIRKLSASIGELEQLKIRAASYEQADNTEPQTQNIKNLKKEGTGSMNKLKVKDLEGKYPGFKVLAVQDENVVLLSEKGEFFLSSAKSENGEIICGSKSEITPVILFANEGGLKIELPVAMITESLQARCAEWKKKYEDEHRTCQTATTTLTAMQAAEKIRRRDEATNAIKARLAQINVDRPEDSKFKEEICANLLTAAAEDRYTELVDADGTFIGASVAAKDVDALCMEEQIKLQAEQAKLRTASATKTYAWEQPSGEPQKPNAGILGAISRVMK